MRTEPPKPIYLVDAYSDPVCLKIRGRASYMNCGPLSDFFNGLIKRKKLNFVVDFSDCTGMDSTFLGLVAGVALELKKPDSTGAITLCHLQDRNLELVQNLGLHRILNVNNESCAVPLNRKKNTQQTLEIIEGSPAVNAAQILKAHENLVTANFKNLDKFQDVISFLKKQISEETEPLKST